MTETIQAPAGALSPHARAVLRHLLMQAMLRGDPHGLDADAPGKPDAAGEGPGEEETRRPARCKPSLQRAFALSAVLTSRGTPEAVGMAPEAVAAAIEAGDDPWAMTDDLVPERPSIRSDARLLLAFARLAQALPGPAEADALLAPGAVTLLTVAGEDVRRAVAGDLDDLGSMLAGLQGRDRSRDEALRVRLVEGAAAGTAGQAGAERARAALERDLSEGTPMLLVASGRAALPEAARLVLGRSVAWPDPSADLVIEMLRLTHSGTGELAEDAIRSILPVPADLARLPAALWDRAWTERTTIRVARALAAACARLPRPSGITLADVHGQPGAVAALGAMAGDLADWQAGRVKWADVSSSALLWGPPGNGKTLLAAALAGTAGAHLVATSYADAQRAGHLGDCLRVMAQRVEEAIARAPSVYYLDELDSFGSRDHGGGRYDCYMTSVINALLEHLSRLADSPGVLVLAGTNHPGRLDPAIVRAGRYDLHLEVGPPDRAGLAAILRAHLGDRAGGADAASTVDRLVGGSGAEAAAVARAALGIARRQGRGLTVADLEAAADRHAPAHAPDVLRAIALHEAGHVVVTAAVGLPLPDRVRITPTGGETRAALPPRLTRADLDARLAVLLAGRAAEALVLGEASAGAGLGPGSDLDAATALALAVEAEHGLGGTALVHAPIPREARHRMPERLWLRIESHLRVAEARAAAVLRERRDLLEAVAAALMAERELDAVRIADLVEADDRAVAPDCFAPDGGPLIGAAETDRSTGAAGPQEAEADAILHPGRDPGRGAGIDRTEATRRTGPLGRDHADLPHRERRHDPS